MSSADFEQPGAVVEQAFEGPEEAGQLETLLPTTTSTGRCRARPVYVWAAVVALGIIALVLGLAAWRRPHVDVAPTGPASELFAVREAKEIKVKTTGTATVVEKDGYRITFAGEGCSDIPGQNTAAACTQILEPVGTDSKPVPPDGEGRRTWICRFPRDSPADVMKSFLDSVPETSIVKWNGDVENGGLPVAVLRSTYEDLLGQLQGAVAAGVVARSCEEDQEIVAGASLTAPSPSSRRLGISRTNIRASPCKWNLDHCDQDAWSVPAGSNALTYCTSSSLAAPYKGFDWQKKSLLGKATVYVVSTGIDVSKFPNEFKGRVRMGFDYFSSPSDCASSTNAACGRDGHSWGTFMAGIIGSETWGIARKANLVSVRIWDANGAGTYESALAGLNWVLQDVTARNVPNPIMFFNMYGGRDTNFDASMALAVQKGIFPVVHAGGFSSSDGACGITPTFNPDAFVVGGINLFNNVASGTGSCVDVWAPATSITSLNMISGTFTTYSTPVAAAALVAGVAASTVMADPTLGGTLTNPLDFPAKMAALIVDKANARKTALGSSLPIVRCPVPK